MFIYKKRDYAKKATHAPPRMYLNEITGQVKFNAPAMTLIENRPLTIGYDTGVFYLVIAKEEDSILDFFVVKNKKRMAFSCLSLVKEILKKSEGRFNFIIDIDHLEFKNGRMTYKLIPKQ